EINPREAFLHGNNNVSFIQLSPTVSFFHCNPISPNFLKSILTAGQFCVNIIASEGVASVPPHIAAGRHHGEKSPGLP
ncbi:MAG: hypothetical protein Q4B44_05190, partial [Erysipelotrichaceae bacterium]|nr:hypothetical protein [Erysipelotrichaceae bacterium]